MGCNKTASKMAAVMLSELLEESEGRLSKTELVMSGLLAESRALEKVERQLLTCLRSKRGLDAGIEEQLRAHRRRMAGLLKDADEVMKAPKGEKSVKVGGLLFEISRNAPGGKAPSEESVGLR